MPGDIRVGGAFVTLSAQSGPYVAGVGAATAANRRLIASYGGFNAALAVSNRAFGRLSASITSSLIATLGYAAGVGLVASSLRSVFTGFLDYDQALIRISKTTGVANVELERLGANLAGIGTERFRGRRPLDISRADIFNIAVAAGQAGVADPREIEEITRASAALQSSSDLIGSAAVRALTRYLQVTNQGIERTNAIASAFTHLGNNVVGTESEISRFSVRVAQNLSAVGQASDAVILGISATLLEAGVEMEAAGSALQRAQLGILRQAADPSAFRFIAQIAGESVDDFEALRQRFVDGTASADDYDTALLALLRTYNRLPDVATDALPGRPQFLAAFVGGGEQNVRNTRVLAALANREERLSRNIALANDGIEDQNQHFTEAERASEAYRARLEVVGRQIEEFGTNLGAGVVPPVAALAENLDILGTAALAATAALATGFGQRRVRAIREVARETQRAARAEVAAARTATSAARQRQVTTRRQIVGAQQVTQASRQIERQQRVLAGTYIATERAQRRLTVAQTHAARVQRNFAQLGRPALQRAGIGVTAAQAEVDRQLRRQAEAQRQLAGTQAVVAGGRPQDTRQLLRGLRRYEQRANQSRAAAMRLNVALQNQAVVTRSLGRRFLTLGAGLFNFFGGGLGLLIGSLAALPLIFSQIHEEGDEAADTFERLRDGLVGIRDALAQQEAGLTDEGETGRQTREFIEEQLRQQEAILADLLMRARRRFEDETLLNAALGASPESISRLRRRFTAALRSLEGDLSSLTPEVIDLFERAGLGDIAQALATSRDRVAELRQLLAETNLTAADVGETAAETGELLGRTFEALPPSLLRAEQAFRAFSQALADARGDALTAARFDASVAGLGPIEQIQRRLIEGERLRIVQFQRANDLAAEQATAAREEAVARRDALREQVPLVAIGTDARKEAEAALAAEEKKVVTLTAQEAVAQRLKELSAGLVVDAEQLVELGEQALEQRRSQIATFEAGTVRQLAGIRPDLDPVVLQALRDRLELENQLEDSQRDVTQAREIDAQSSVAHQQALREFYRVQNAGANALRSAQQDLLVNERARELAARRVLELNERRVAAGDQVTDSLLEQVRAAQTSLASLRAEQLQLELTAAAATLMREEYERIARASAALIEAQRDNPFDELVQSNIEILGELERVGAETFAGLAEEAANALFTGEDNWRDFADSVIQELLRIAIQATIVNNLVAGLGLSERGGGGSLFGALGSIFGNLFHEGGRTEGGGQRRQLRGGLRSDELFAVLQKGEVVIPRHLAGHLLSGNFDALRGWLARLPRFHEGGIAGGGHLPREDVARLIAAISRLTAAVRQLQTQLGQAPLPQADLPSDMPVLERVEEGINAVHERLGLPPVEGEREQDILRNQEEMVRELREQRRFAESRVSETRERDREPVEITPEILERMRRDFGDDERFFRMFPDLRPQAERIADEVRALRLAVGRISGADDTTQEPPRDDRISGASTDIVMSPRIVDLENFPGFDADTIWNLKPQEFRDIIVEIRDRARRPGDPSEFNRLRELRDQIVVDTPIPPFRPEPGAIAPGGRGFAALPPGFALVRVGGFGPQTVGDTPRPDLFPDSENAIVLFRQQSDAAFGESAEALTGTFGAGGVAGTVLNEEVPRLLQGTFGAAGTMGQVTTESRGLLTDLFNAFGGQLSGVLNNVLGDIGGSGTGVGSVIGNLFRFHEGSGDVGHGTRRYHRPAGLRSDELLAVLQKGEIVLPRHLAQRVRDGGYQNMDELRMWITRLPRFHEGGHVGGAGGGGLGGAPTRIELINTTSTPIEAVDNGQRVDAGARVQSLILRDIRRNGPVTQGMRLALR